MILKTLPGNAGYMVKYFQKSNLKKNSNRTSAEWVSSVAMEMPLAKAYLKTSHIMKWVNSVNSFENQLSIVKSIRTRLDFDLKNNFINIFNQNTSVRPARARF